jgi:hypothetical protein
MKEKEIDTLFSEQLLQKVSVNYRFMVKWETKDIDELYNTARFSQSHLHRSPEYITYGPCKPVSNVCLTTQELTHEKLF